MRAFALLLALALVLSVAAPVLAQDGPKPEFVVEKMAYKFVRGVTNVATAIVELPKQSYLSVRDRGAVGYVVGPLKGVGMTVYRGFMGAAEAIFFPVPQPGYYDPMVEPEYVWMGWDEARDDRLRSAAGNPDVSGGEGK
ncbi:exosortase system-associated protein, TIGR04073 family [Geobacter anodireducens]|uniref:Exosortase system-associated protein, TIGR04073 family n=1 Tax=Geobacter anodireducens TaxID=1340425 RepID=A0ABR9NX29_9BACT|nr:exosortase system-associated protein, TIGR04073 family [Geobacter anodireducens]ANA41363.1 hypothetical protein A2G06_15180 [Geobacter anodireducens]MBE2888804.1 exosortase system-associated protein, TIGR04073 family [Geobacter anodireducens]HMN02053.1 exosortase system-associated protein, TIGR04073 family [Geobacter anodireducens]